MYFVVGQVAVADTAALGTYSLAERPRLLHHESYTLAGGFRRRSHIARITWPVVRPSSAATIASVSATSLSTRIARWTGGAGAGTAALVVRSVRALFFLL